MDEESESRDAQGPIGRRAWCHLDSRRTAILCALVLIFAVLVIALSRVVEIPFFVIAGLGIGFGVLGLVLVVLTARRSEARTRKVFFILTGASAAGIPICAILHNLVYGLFILWFGKGFWGPGGDEPVFFILGVLVCPALVLVGAVGSGVLLVKARLARNRNGL